MRPKLSFKLTERNFVEIAVPVLQKDSCIARSWLLQFSFVQRPIILGFIGEILDI